jgi:hypothetical protein
VGLTTLPCKKRKLLRSLQEIQPFLMEEDCGGGQGLSWAVEPRREREKYAGFLNREIEVS